MFVNWSLNLSCKRDSQIFPDTKILKIDSVDFFRLDQKNENFSGSGFSHMWWGQRTPLPPLKMVTCRYASNGSLPEYIQRII